MTGIRFIAALCFILTTTVASAENWPGFRGAAGTGISAEKNLPLRWSMTENIAWKIDLPGRGNSSPAVTSSRVYLTAQEKDTSLWVISVNRDSGNIVWKKRVGEGVLAAKGSKTLYVHRHNSATPSPSADEDHVWAFFGTGLLVCLDADGEMVWRHDLVQEYGAYDITFGMGSSPRLWGDLLYVACMTKGPSYVVALNKKNGEEVWKTPRRLPAKDDGPDAYSTPIVLETAERTELLIAGSDHVNSYDLLSGKQLWVSSGLKINSPYGRVIASPAVGEGVIVQCAPNPANGGLGRAIAITTGGQGEITKSHRRWTFERESADVPTPVCYQGKLYMARDNGVGVCIDLKTGNVHYKKRLGDKVYRASVVAGDDKVYCLGRNGLCTVLQPGSRWKVLAKNQLEGQFFATPAISDGVMYFRGHHRLYAVGPARNASE